MDLTLGIEEERMVVEADTGDAVDDPSGVRRRIVRLRSMDPHGANSRQCVSP